MSDGEGTGKRPVGWDRDRVSRPGPGHDHHVRIWVKRHDPRDGPCVGIASVISL